MMHKVNELIIDKAIYELIESNSEFRIFLAEEFFVIKEKIFLGEFILLQDYLYKNDEVLEISNDSYKGFIILHDMGYDNFWQFHFLIHNSFKGIIDFSLIIEKLIESFPDRNWEITIPKGNNEDIISALIQQNFERLKLWDEEIFHFKKAKNTTVTIIGNAYLQPISDLLFLQKKRSKSDYNDTQTSITENGYSVSLCLLIMACFESLIRYDIYINKKTDRYVLDYLKGKHLNNFIQDIEECFVIRDSIIHNHIWQIDHTYLELKVIDAKKMNYSGDRKYDENVDTINMVTNKLKLNVNPIKINRNDVKKVLVTFVESLSLILPFDILNNIIVIDTKISRFREIYHSFIEEL